MVKGAFFYCLLSSSLAQSPYLVVSGEKGVILELPLAKTPTWLLRWNHSVTGVTVTDYYYWNGSEMLLTDSHTPAFDAGLGHIPERGELVSDGDNGYFILNLDEAVPDNAYLLRVGSEAVNHRIEHDGVVYSLSKLAASKRVTIQVTSR